MRILFLISFVFGYEIEKSWFQNWNETVIESSLDISSISDDTNQDSIYSVKRYANPGFRQAAGEIQAGSEVFYELTFSAIGKTYVVDGVSRKADEIFFYSVSQCQAGETKIFQNFECGSDDLNFAFYGKYKSRGQMRFRFSFTAWSDFDGQLTCSVNTCLKEYKDECFSGGTDDQFMTAQCQTGFSCFGVFC